VNEPISTLSTREPLNSEIVTVTSAPRKPPVFGFPSASLPLLLKISSPNDVSVPPSASVIRSP
jgi:hypothetical protein